MKNGRLFELLYLLVERRALTAGELAERFEVSERTIYRDVDALSAAGVPVYTQRGQGGGIRLMDQFVLDRCLLSPREQDEVLFALRALLSTVKTLGYDRVICAFQPHTYTRTAALFDDFVEVLKQPQNSPIPVEKQVIIIYAVVSGALLDIPANQIGEFEKELFSFVDSIYSDIPESIRTTGKLEDDVKEKLTKAIEECKSKFLSEH